MSAGSFALRQFSNRNGVISWRLEDRLHGVRERRNFNSREDAAAERAVREAKAEQAAAGMHPVMTHLDHRPSARPRCAQIVCAGCPCDRRGKYSSQTPGVSCELQTGSPARDSIRLESHSGRGLSQLRP